MTIETLNAVPYSVLPGNDSAWNRPSRWVICAIAALILHSLLLWLMPDFLNASPPIPIELGGINANELDTIKKQWSPEKKFLISNAVKNTSEAPKNARYESSENRAVDHETRAAHPEDLARPGLLGSGTQDTGAREKKPQPIPLAKLSNLSDITDPLRKPKIAPVESENANRQSGHAGGGAAQDIDDNAPISAENMLNTAETIYHSFYMRMYNSIGPAWMSRIRDVSSRVRVKQGEYQTVADIKLDSDGNFAGYEILKSSGIEAFDQAVPYSWQKLPRFPNPPRGLIGRDGFLHMRWSFTVMMGESNNWQYLPPERIE